MKKFEVGLIFASGMLAGNLLAQPFYPTTVTKLIQDINTANTNNQDDTIFLGNREFILTQPNNDDNMEGYNGLPSIQPDNGHSLTIKEGKILRDGSVTTPGFRLIRVAPQAQLLLQKVHLENGLANDDNDSDFPGNGGGAILNDGTLEIEQSAFFNNQSTSLTIFGDAGGGAIYNGGVIISIEDSIFSGNSSAFDFGGAILNNVDVATGTIPGSINLISRTTFESNFAAVNGGAIANIAGSVITTIADSTFFGNIAGGGGALFNGPGPSIITSIINSTLANNFAIGTITSIQTVSALGGAIQNFGTISSILNSTIAYNSAASSSTPPAQNGSGGGIFTTAPGSIGNIESTIIARNFAQQGNGPDIFGDPLNSSYDLIGVGGDGNTFTNNMSNNLVGSYATPLNPLLGPLKDNGGPTFTMALLSTSPAIDAGRNPNMLPFDQRGAPFVRSFGGQTDIGAYEVQVFPVPPMVEKVFDPSEICIFDKTTIAITLSNPTAIDVSIFSFIDLLPTHLRIVRGSAFSTCGVEPVVSGRLITLSGGSIPANGSCEIELQVKACDRGSFTNHIRVGALQTSNGPNDYPAIARLEVIDSDNKSSSCESDYSLE